MACESVKQRGVRIKLTCSASSENQKITDWLLRLIDNHRTWGFGLCFLYLRFRQTIWLESQACLPRVSPVGAQSAHQAQKEINQRNPPTLGRTSKGQHHLGSMDFMHDRLEDGRSIRLLNVIDDHNREALGL
jgi:putative transposase